MYITQIKTIAETDIATLDTKTNDLLRELAEDMSTGVAAVIEDIKTNVTSITDINACGINFSYSMFINTIIYLKWINERI